MANVQTSIPRRKKRLRIPQPKPPAQVNSSAGSMNSTRNLISDLQDRDRRVRRATGRN